jgi:Rrf2 family iron-sulfur cluster assembly transcriptional regulator
MVDLANRQGKEGLVSLADLATLQHKSLSYLEPLFTKLKAAKLVESKKGPNGGYRTKNTKLVTIAAIVTAITGDEPDPDKAWEEITGGVRDYLSNVTLFDRTR